MNNEKRKLICTFLEKYLLKKFPTLEIKKDKLFTCFAEDTPIQLKSGQFKNIKDIEIGDEIIGVRKQGHMKNFLTSTKVLNNINQGKKTIWHVKVDDKILKVTPEHHFLTKDKKTRSLKWEQIQNIIANNDIVYNINSPVLQNELNYVIGLFCGFFDGDGYFTKFHTLFYISQKIECKFIEWVLNYLNISFLKIPDKAKPSSFLNEKTGPSYTYKLHYQALHYYRLGYSLKLENNSDYEYGYLMGLILSDGSVSTRTSKLRFDLTQKFPIPYVEDICERRNICLYTYKRLLKTHYVFKNCFDLILYAPKSVKIQKLWDNLNLTIHFLKSKNAPILLKIEKDVNVYDLTTDTQNFIANGVVVHNCPFFEEHSDGDNSPTCKIYSSHGYKLKCMHPSHSEHDLGDIFSIVRKVEPDMADLDDTDIGEYLIHMLDIQTDDEVDKTLAVYANSGFKLIPLQAGHADPKENKVPIGGVSWKKTMSDDLTQWHEWYDAHLNLGLVLGKESGVLAIDIDSPTAMEQMKDKIGITATQVTSRGMHFLYLYESEFDLINHVNLRNKGFDMEIRANNSYIVVAPSSTAGEKRIWNGQKIQKMSPELKAFLLGLIDKPKEEVNSESEKMEGCTLKGDLEGLEGRCNDFFTQMGGVLRKKLPPKQTEYALLTFNKALKNPMPYADIKRMMYQISKYNNYDKKELAEEVFSHLKMVEQSNARDLQSSLGYEKKDIEEVLSYLIAEGKVIKHRNTYKSTNEVEWEEDFISISKPLNIKVPYFEDYARFSSGSMVVLGAKSGNGKTTIVCNLLKSLVGQGNRPYLLCTEADSKFGLITASLGLKIGDYKFKKVQDPSTVELQDNAVTIVDWLAAPESDYSKMESIYKRFEEQLVKHGGLLIIMAQLKSENGQFYAEDMTKFYSCFVAKYLWSPIKNAKGETYDWDAQNTYFKTIKIRDSKLDKQYLTIPAYYNKDTKEITLRKS